ncbi:hypothetical protein Taro_044592 [Colocasia esculenta]|uniref:Uncharacterized protein n=1 Tax=Colocasia esculenta TaxID=4460 RepID=A0A843X302_COLES|nr:hypothetical protein [Colocasia esculenta]
MCLIAGSIRVGDRRRASILQKASAALDAATSVDTACASVDLLSQNSSDGVLEKPLVSTLPHLVSTHCPSDYEVQEEEQVEDGNASE